MPTWNQILSQLRNPSNPVVFFDISVGTTVSYKHISLSVNIKHKNYCLGNWSYDF